MDVTALALSLEWVNSDLSVVVFLFGGTPCVHLSIRVQSTLSKSEVMKRETTTESVIGIARSHAKHGPLGRTPGPLSYRATDQDLLPLRFGPASYVRPEYICLVGHCG